MSIAYSSEGADVLKNFGPIDLVYLWCDGSDPTFTEKKKARLIETRPPEIEENIGDVRYIQHDELRYSLRSAFLYTPWVRHIYVVTDNQKPKWLQDHPKIKVIDHKEIIPNELLPTFSAICIEMYLDKIPGLSEHFLLANDDTFFYRHVTPFDFFDKNGNPIVNVSCNEAKRMTETLAQSILCDEAQKDWHKSLVRAWMLHRKKYRNNMPFYTPAHSIDSYRKSYYSEVLAIYPQLRDVNSKPFRTGEEITRIIFSYEMINNHNCHVTFNPKPDVFSRLKKRFFSVDMISVCRMDIRKLKRDLRIFNPKTFCLNNLPKESQRECIDFFEKIFPVKAPWEK